MDYETEQNLIEAMMTRSLDFLYERLEKETDKEVLSCINEAIYFKKQQLEN